MKRRTENGVVGLLFEEEMEDARMDGLRQKTV